MSMWGTSSQMLQQSTVAAPDLERGVSPLAAPVTRSIQVCIMVIQVYAPANNAEEAEVEWLYEDLQDLLEIISSPEKMSFSS